MAGWARPVRMVLNSSLATATAFSIFSSAPRRISYITVAPVGPLPGWSGMPARRTPALFVPSKRRYPSPARQRQQPASLLPAGAPSMSWPRRGIPSGLAHLEAGERPHGDALLGQDLLDRLLRILHECLLGEHYVLEERAQPALDNLADRLLGLAFIAGDLLRDAPLVLDHIAGYLVTGHVLRPHRRYLLRDVLARLLRRRVQLDEHAHGRRQGTVGLVQVAGHIAALEQGVAAEFQVLLERGSRFLDELLSRRAGADLHPQQGQPVGGPVGQRGGGDVGRHLLEELGLGHEVGLAVQLDEDARAGAVQDRGDEPVGRDPAGPLP